MQLSEVPWTLSKRKRSLAQKISSLYSNDPKRRKLLDTLSSLQPKTTQLRLPSFFVDSSSSSAWNNNKAAEEDLVREISLDTKPEDFIEFNPPSYSSLSSTLMLTSYVPSATSVDYSKVPPAKKPQQQVALSPEDKEDQREYEDFKRQLSETSKRKTQSSSAVADTRPTKKNRPNSNKDPRQNTISADGQLLTAPEAKQREKAEDDTSSESDGDSDAEEEGEEDEEDRDLEEYERDTFCELTEEEKKRYEHESAVAGATARRLSDHLKRALDNVYSKKIRVLESRIKDEQRQSTTTTTKKRSLFFSNLVEGIIPLERSSILEILKDKEAATRYLKMYGLRSNTVLTDTQHEGIAFLYSAENTIGGALLSHDMGLGKTLQVLALIALTKFECPGVTLIMVPPNLPKSWIKQTYQFFGKNIKLLHFERRSTKNQQGVWYSYGGKFGCSGQKFSGDPTNHDISMHDALITHYDALTKSVWKNNVRDPVRNQLKKMSSKILARFFEDKGKGQRMIFKRLFPDLDWRTFVRVRSSSALINFKLKENGGSAPLCGDVISYPYVRVVVDEAHRMKNATSLLATLCHAFPAKRKIAISGTPVWDKNTDFWSLFRFLGVPRLPTYTQFKTMANSMASLKESVSPESWEEWILTGGTTSLAPKSGLTWDSASGKVKGKATSTVLDTRLTAYCSSLTKLKPVSAFDLRLSPHYKKCKYIIFLLNRYMQRISKEELSKKGKTDRELLEEQQRYSQQGWTLKCHSLDAIPPSYQKTFYVDMQPELKGLYNKLNTGFKEDYQKSLEPPKPLSMTGDMLSKGPGNGAGRRFMLDIMTHLRIMCSSPKSLKQEVIQRHFDLGERSQLAACSSPKLELLRSYIQTHVKLGEKFAIFVHFLETVKEVSHFLKERLGMRSIQVTGADTGSEKDDKCMTFCKSKSIFALVATHCISLGMTLVEANHCIIMTPWWTEKEEEQCAGRFHRIGQVRDTKIAYFVTRDSIEEKIRKVAEDKEGVNKFTLQQYVKLLWD